MYTLRVLFPGDGLARYTTHIEHSPDVLATIPQLLSKHEGCERVEVYSGTTRLFSVDYAGNSRPG